MRNTVNLVVHLFIFSYIKFIIVFVVTASEWMKIVMKEYYTFLQNNLSKDEFYDNEACWHVLKQQFEW